MSGRLFSYVTQNVAAWQLAKPAISFIEGF